MNDSTIKNKDDFLAKRKQCYEKINQEMCRANIDNKLLTNQVNEKKFGESIKRLENGIIKTKNNVKYQADEGEKIQPTSSTLNEFFDDIKGGELNNNTQIIECILYIKKLDFSGKKWDCILTNKISVNKYKR